MALLNRSDYEVVFNYTHLGITQVQRIYPYGMSLDWMLEHLVRREAINLRYTTAPADPRTDRKAKDRVIVKR